MPLKNRNNEDGREENKRIVSNPGICNYLHEYYEKETFIHLFFHCETYIDPLWNIKIDFIKQIWNDNPRNNLNRIRGVPKYEGMNALLYTKSFINKKHKLHEQINTLLAVLKSKFYDNIIEIRPGKEYDGHTLLHNTSTYSGTRINKTMHSGNTNLAPPPPSRVKQNTPFGGTDTPPGMRYCEPSQAGRRHPLLGEAEHPLRGCPGHTDKLTNWQTDRLIQRQTGWSQYPAEGEVKTIL